MNSTDIQIVRRLPTSVGPASAQLASGSALLAGLEQTGLPALRWQRIDPPALLLGSAQRTHEADLSACAAAGVSVHRRGSGGGIVLSDTMLLLLDLALPEGHPLFIRDVTESYRWLGEVWAAALHTLALDTWLVPVALARANTQALDPLLKRVCFGGRSPYEVLVGERKLVGLAQIRRRGGALFQAGIYLHWKPGNTAALLSATATERSALAARLGERVVGLRELVGGPVPEAAPVIAAVETALARFAQLSPVDDEWREEEQSAQTTALARYAAIG